MGCIQIMQPITLPGLNILRVHYDYQERISRICWHINQRPLVTPKALPWDQNGGDRTCLRSPQSITPRTFPGSCQPIRKSNLFFNFVKKETRFPRLKIYFSNAGWSLGPFFSGDRCLATALEKKGKVWGNRILIYLSP